jgi:predicted enzyme related to lactoylglutathione lyase
VPNPVVHFEILGKDVKGLQDFYAKVFDWKIDTSNAAYGMVEAVAGGIPGGVGGTDLMVGHLTFYVEVDDVDAYLKKAESLGGRVMMPKTSIPGSVTYGLIADPEGHLIGVMEAQH